MTAPRLSTLTRLALHVALSALLAAWASWLPLSAQLVGRNVNMVSGVTWPGGDPFLQRQNEPSLAASSRNPLHLLAGSNDYRSVDLPGLPDSEETGDAWLGLYKSVDGGARWTSTLLPGYPQDTSAAGTASPIKGYQAAADPVVRAGAGGLLFYAGLAFDRAAAGAPPEKSAIFVARFIDNNNLEAGDPIRYLGTSIVTSVPAGVDVFLDKPWMAVDIPRPGAPTCQIVTPDAGGSLTQRIPAGTIYVAFMRKTIESTGERFDIMLSRSTNCGATFTPPVRVSRAEDRVNQGATIAISPVDGKLYVAWRRFDPTGDTDAIMVARSLDRGASFLPPGIARKFFRATKRNGFDPWRFMQRRRGRLGPAQEVDEVSPFDQSTSDTALSFRTNSYPTMAIDATGRVHLAWSERGYAVNPDRADPVNGDARVLLVTSPDGSSWTAPLVVADVGQRGHQIMPSIAIAGNRLVLAYYDLQENRSGIVDTKHIDDQTAFARTSPDRRHTIDLRTTMGTPGATPTFAPSTRVSRYLQGFVPGVPLKYDGAGNIVPSDLQANPPNLPMFKLGTAPFLGDYIDVAAAPGMVPDGSGGWRFNVGSGSIPPVFHVAWTDNRDVRAPFDGQWTQYTPPDYFGLRPNPGPGVACVPGRAGARNQNIYTAPITDGLRVGSPGNTKPLSLDLQRAFVVYAENTSAATRTFRFTILNQPPGGRASFDQLPLPPYTSTSPAPLTVIDVTTPKYTTASRSVYVTSTDPHATITVDVTEITAVGGTEIAGGLEGTIRLNPDITNPEVDNPEVDNPEVDNTDILQAEIQNPEVDNPEVDNPEVDNPEVDNPEVDNPEVDNIVISNPEVDNPEVDNPEVDNPEVDNPEVDNPEVDNTALLEGGGTITDITWTISNVGNTTTAYNLNVFLNGTTVSPALDLQLLIYRRYRTPAIAYNSCDLRTVTQNVLVANIPGLELLVGGEAPGDQNDPGASNATLWLAPGEEAQVTLRVFDPDASDNVILNGASIDPQVIPEQDVSLVSRAQPVSTPLAEGGITEPASVGADPFPVFTVTTTADAGPGSLRSAMLAANAQPGLDSILFDIPGPGPHTISPLSPLPALTEPAVVDGTTQPGYAGTPLIEIEGSSAGAGAIGLNLQGGASTIRALAINRFATGIEMTLAGGNAVIGSHIGTNPAGTVAQPNTTGIRVDFSSPSNGFGGVLPGEGNLISGNTGVGLLLLSGGHRVVGNKIGSDISGTVDLGNAVYGIDTGVGANVIGEVGAGNLISGNDSAGAIIRGSGNVVRANRIGTDVTGTVAIANGIGLGVWDADAAVIGGTTAGEGNQISGNGFGLGLAFSTGATTPAVVRGNLLGTAANGVDPLPNVTASVFAAGAARAVVGGTGAGEGNTIAFGVFGAWIQDTVSITVRGNSMFGFGFRAIDLNVDGPTLNDPLDADGGPNLLQNYPGVSGVSTTSVGGEIFTAPSSSYTIDFYASTSPADARTWIASVAVATDAAGYALIPAQPVALASGQFVTATATDAAGNTSEFAPAVVVP